MEDKHRKTTSRLRSLYDYTMGVLWLGVGIFFLFHDKFGVEIGMDNDSLFTIFGVSSILYGLFRLYRGYKTSKM